jgi:putative salt-induced outer membrane protein
LFAVLIGLPAAPHAQDPPAAPAPPPPPPPTPKVEGSGEFAFVNTTGNAQSTSIGLRGEVIYRPAPWLLKTRAGFVRLESDEALEAQSFAFLFRAERALTPRVSLFSEYDYLRDLFAGIEHKNLVTGGVSYKLLDTPRQKLLVDGGLGVSSEQRLVGEDVTAAVLLGGLGYVVKVSATAEVTDDVRYEQSLDQGENWRLDNTLALVTKINTIFSLKVSNVVRYVNSPVEGFETTDTITSVALVAKF